MQTKTFWSSLLLLAWACALLLPAAPPTLAQSDDEQPTPTGSVLPLRGPPGTTFTFHASGFGSSEQLNIWLLDPNGRNRQLGPDVSDNRIFTDPAGDARWTWTAGGNLPAGDWLAQVEGATTRRELSIPFTVTGDQSGAPRSSWFVEPTSGPPGTTFTFVGRSTAFLPGEQVGSWFIQPDGTIRDVQEGQSVDPDGQIYRIWTAPLDAPGGEWLFRARGVASAHVLDMSFTIDGPAEPVAAPPPPPLQVEPTSGPPGITFTFTIGGFNAGEVVGNWLVRPDGASLDAAEWIRADENGTIVWQWFVPPDTPGGTWRFRASGTQTSGEKELSFIIESATPLPSAGGLPPGSVSPPAGPVDTPFTFAVSGFQPDERIYYWIETTEGDLARDVNGVLIVEEEEREANADGTASWVWEAHQRMQPDSYELVVRGRLSGPEVVRIPFRITERPTEDRGNPSPVDPSAGGPRTTFSFYAENYNSGELLDIYLEDPTGRTLGRDEEGYAITDVTASREGIARWQWTAPDDVLEGEWLMVARGRDSRVMHTISFLIFRQSPTPPPPSGVEPGRGPPGTTFVFSGEGFNARERVGFWLTRPDGRIVRVGDPAESEADEIGSDENGRVEIRWQAPADAMRGTWHLTMRTSRPEELDDDITYVIYFTVE